MKSYLKFLSRNKLYTAIEAVGLIVSLAFVLLTGHYVWTQRQMTRNVPDYKDVYTFYRTTSGQSGIGQSWGFAYQARESVPEVEKAALFWKAISQNEETIDLNGRKYHVKSFMVGGDFFDIFPVDFESGGPEVMSDISNVIVSRSFANRLGGEANAIGSVIDDRYTVAAIIKESPNPIFGDVDVIYNIENLTNRKNAPFRLDVIPFVKVRKGTDRDALEVKADTLVARAFDAFGGRAFLEDSGLVRYDEIWFSPANNQSLKKGSRTYTGIILLVTIILLLSAIFNFINLNVALSGKRTKEMATRKILGAGNESLFAGRLLESLAFTSVCLFPIGCRSSRSAYSLVQPHCGRRRRPRQGPVLSGVDRNLCLIYCPDILDPGIFAGLDRHSDPGDLGCEGGVPVQEKTRVQQGVHRVAAGVFHRSSGTRHRPGPSDLPYAEQTAGRRC